MKDRKARDKAWHVLRSAKRVGMTREIFKLVIRSERKECAICGRKGKLVADHSHKYKRHRGRLCHRCNTALGLFQDDPVRLRVAADYVQEFLERVEDGFYTEGGQHATHT